MDIKNDIQNYIKYKETIDYYEKKIKSLKEKKNRFEINIKNYFIKNKYKNKVFNKNKLEIKINKNKQGLSKKLLNKAINKYLTNKFKFNNTKSEKITIDIINYIESLRKIEKKIILKCSDLK